MRARPRPLLLFGAFLTSTLLAAAWPAPAPPSKKPSRSDLAAGQKLFERHCSLCHGIGGKGGRGPALNRIHLNHAPDDKALRSVIVDGIPPNMPEGYFLDEKDIANLVAFVRSLSKVPPDHLPGDAHRGRAVYEKSGCPGCHITYGAGVGYGPELTGIGNQRSASFLEKVINKPSSVLPDDFLLVKATTASGETVEGIRVNEDSFTIQVKDSSGKFHSLRKLDLKDLVKMPGQTPMPSFEGILSASEKQDLIAFLASQRGKQ